MSENNQKGLEEEEINKNVNTQIQHHNRLKENRKDIDEPDIVLHPITSHDESLYPKDSNNSNNQLVEHQFLTPINITTTASDKTLSSAFVDEDESCEETSGNNLSINLLSPSTSGGKNIASQNIIPSGSGTQQQSTTSDEDNVIQDLLEDIRGSFERQFDDEFNFDEGYVLRG